MMQDGNYGPICLADAIHYSLLATENANLGGEAGTEIEKRFTEEKKWFLLLGKIDRPIRKGREKGEGY